MPFAYDTRWTSPPSCGKTLGVTPQPTDLDGVRRRLRELTDAGKTEELIELVVELLGSMARHNDQLTQRLAESLRQLYGRKSEKTTSEQLSLLLDELGGDSPAAAADAVADGAGDDDGDVEQPERPPKPVGRGKRGGDRSELPADLPRRRRRINVPDDQRVCRCCGHEMAFIGVIRTELLEFQPAMLMAVDQEREKLACKRCGKHVVAAPSEQPMDRGRPGPGLLAAVTVAKAQDSLPLYRQCRIYQRGGVKLSDSTLGDWFAFTALALEPLARRIRQLVLASPVVGADDTGLPVLDRSKSKADRKGKGKGKTKRGHMWCYVGYGDDARLAAFDYTPTWERDGPRAFLRDFRGILQGDGYKGFHKVLSDAGGNPIVSDDRRLGCCMHVRRKFEAALDAGDKRGAVALAFFQKLYRIEKLCKQGGLNHADRRLRRTNESLPVLEEFYAWVHDLHPKLVPGDKLHAATRYAVNQEAFVRRCFESGRYEIDNGEVERQLRRIALGRNNWLFAGSDAAAARLATIFTVLASAHIHELDPQAYLTDVIDKLQNGWPKHRLDELLPHRWVAPAEPRWLADSEAVDP